MKRDDDPLTCPPLAMLPTGEGPDRSIMDWSMVAPVDVEMFGVTGIMACAEVWHVRLSAN
jgi:hypothetical protein